MIDSKQLKRSILEDMKVKLSEEFDQNFTRKAFFSRSWQPRKRVKGKPMRGSLLLVSGRLRRSLRAKVTASSVLFHSDTPYAAVHNDGLKASVNVRSHSRIRRSTGKSYQVGSFSRRMQIPQRQFIGDAPEVKAAIKAIIEQNMKEYIEELKRLLNKH